jgi:hypothetical protein
MEEVSRRSFLKRSSAVVAAAGVATVVPVGAVAASTKSRTTHGSSKSPAEVEPGAALDETVVAHVRDLGSGEIAVMAGEREVILHDRSVASTLYRATRKGR